MLAFDPQTLPEREVYQLLTGLVAPRPIAFVSTLDTSGIPNLAPYSFFNVFSSNPPTVIFSSNRKPVDMQLKDTLRNVEATGEVVINMVSHDILGQMALCSIAYPPEVNEFEKSGLTPIASDLVKPFRVKESPAQLECKVKQIIPLGAGGGAGNLVICEVVRIHISEQAMDQDGKIDPDNLDLMGRLGRTFYVRSSGEAVHSLYQPTDKLGMGFGRLPLSALHSKILSGNDLARIAALESPPSEEDIEGCEALGEFLEIGAHGDPVHAWHRFAKSLIEIDRVPFAAIVLWYADTYEDFFSR